MIATAAVIAGWPAAAALIATAVLAATTLLVAWIRFHDFVERSGLSAGGIGLAPRRLTGAGRLLAMLVWVGAAALLVVGSRLLTGPANPTPTTSSGVGVISLWCGFRVSLGWRDQLTRQPRLSRPILRR